jgi:hypothetical protein
MNPLYYFAHYALRIPLVRNTKLFDKVMTDAAAARSWTSTAAENVGEMCGLSAQEIADLSASVQLHRRAIAGQAGIVAEMPKPQNPTECYFTAIFRGQDGELRYYTLEQTLFGDQCLPCAWTESVHAIVGGACKPEVEPFIAAIEQAEERRDEGH